MTLKKYTYNTIRRNFVNYIICRFIDYNQLYIVYIGPGCSSVGYGATQEIGPFLVDTKENGLTFNPYAWNKGKYLLFSDIIYVNENE